MESQLADSAVDRDLTVSALHIDTDQKEQSPHHHRPVSQKVQEVSMVTKQKDI